VSGPQEASLDVVAFDGPSGAGKSTIAKGVASRLGWRHLDTGSMYRAATLWLLEHRVDPADIDAVERSAATLALRLGDAGRVWLGEREVTRDLRRPEVDACVSVVSVIPVLRREMRGLQRAQAAQGPLVAEGRDMTSVVFPDARWKFYIDAAAEERARRRQGDYERAGTTRDLAQLLGEMLERDRLDTSRADSPLVRVPDAVYLDTTKCSAEQVVEEIVGRIERERGG
jgi:cytidylate kinase